MRAKIATDDFEERRSNNLQTFAALVNVDKSSLVIRILFSHWPANALILVGKLAMGYCSYLLGG